MSIQRQRFLENEYEHQPVPIGSRKPLWSVSLIWAGFPLVITGALVGGSIVDALGFRTGLLAMLVGNLILFAYVGIQSAIAAKSGMSFALIATRVFGVKGYRLTSGLLATVVIGWFAVQTGITGSTLHSSWGITPLWLDILAGLIFMGITIVGVKALSIIGAVSVPFFLIMGGLALKIALDHSSWPLILHFSGHFASTLTFGGAVTMVIALFIDSGTMTPDFTRWAKSPKDAVIATFWAFPLANFLSMFFGAVVSAAGTESQGNFASVIVHLGPWGALMAAAFLFVNSGSVCSHCLYNAATGFSQILGRKLRWMALILGLVGTWAAAMGMGSLLATWLSFLAVIVPGIGGSIMGHFLVFKKARVSLPGIAFTSWILGGLASLSVQLTSVPFPAAVTGMLTAFGAYLVLAFLRTRIRSMGPDRIVEEE